MHHNKGRPTTLSRNQLKLRLTKPGVNTLGLSALVVSMLFAVNAYAQGDKLNLDLPAAALDKSINQLAQQAGVQIIFASGVTTGKIAPALKGDYTASEALDKLLTGSGLKIQKQGDKTFTVEQPATKIEALPEVTVTAATEKETAVSHVRGYVAKRSATATKTDTPLHETPQSISIITRDQIEAQAADSLDQAFAYTGGIMSLNGGGNRHVMTGFTIRGFNATSSPLYLNGSKFPIAVYSGAMEPYMFERIELLKGPASILYGQAAPGGIINLVSKRPTSAPLRELEVQVGSWNRRQGAIDLGGPVTDDGTVRYRLTGLVRDSESMIRQIPDDRTLLSGALDWRLSDSTMLTLLANYDKTNAGYDTGKPYEGTILPNPFGKISRKRYISESSFDKYEVKGATLGYILEHKFNDQWQFRQNALAYNYEASNAYAGVFSRVNTANPAVVNRYSLTRDDKDKGFSLDNQLQGKLSHGLFQHTVLFGLDWNKSDWSRQQHFGSFSAFNLYAPSYGAQPVLGAAVDSQIDATQLGFYMQDQIKFDNHWIALAGGRYDEARSDSGTGSSTEKSHAFSPRLGLMYLFDNGIAPYYSYTSSFQPIAGTDANLKRFQPTTGKQHEVGIKYQPPGINALVTFAAYEITQQNVLTTDLANPGSSTQTGEVRSRGLELETRLSLSNQLDLVGAVATTDAKITESNNGDVGNRPVAVPRNTASLWADYRVQFIPGLSTGLGVRYIGTQEISQIELPTYTVIDAAVRYQWDKWRLALNIKNLTDKNYVASCAYSCYLGDERNAVLTARYSW